MPKRRTPEATRRHAWRPSWVVRLLCAGAIYAVLVLPWPGVQSGYALLYRVVCHFGLNAIFSPADVIVTRLAASDGRSGNGFDTRVDVQVRRASMYFPLSARRSGYLYAALLFALVVVSPIPGRRRVRALLIGLPLLHAPVVVGVAAKVVSVMCDTPEIASVPFPAWAGPLASYATEALLRSRSILTGITLAIWVGLTLRADDVNERPKRDGSNM